MSQIPLTGSLSIASVVILVGVVTGMLNFTALFVRLRKSLFDLPLGKISWRNYPVVLISHGIMVFIILLMAFRLIGQLFQGATFDFYTSAVIGSVLVVIVNVFMINLAYSLAPSSLIKTLIFIIFGGLTIAMITNSDYQWWLYNLSFLGTHEATNAWQFNMTLVLSSLLMVDLIDYLFELIYECYGKTKRFMVLKDY